MSDTKQFTRSNKKVKLLGCPYEDDSEVIELTAEQYANTRHCLCQYCWSNRPTYRWVETAEWRTDDESATWRADDE